MVLDSPERSIERIRLRVRKGGHDVADADVRRRYHRSLRQLPWFLQQADRAWIHDNSGSQPRLIGEKTAGMTVVDVDALPVVMAAVNAPPETC